MIRQKTGFTMIELLVVIGIVGIIATFGLMAMNPEQSRDAAEDAVRMNQLDKVVKGIETFYAAEGQYPTGPNDPALATYLSDWPETSEASEEFKYVTQDDGDTDYVCVSVPMATASGSSFKYIAPHDVGFTEGYAECGGRVLSNCPNECDTNLKIEFPCALEDDSFCADEPFECVGTESYCKCVEDTGDKETCNCVHNEGEIPTFCACKKIFPLKYCTCIWKGSPPEPCDPYM